MMAVECPRCRTPVPKTRRFFKSWAWARWDCATCGSTLGFSIGRRLWIGVPAGVVGGVLGGGGVSFWRTGIPFWAMLILFAILALAIAWAIARMEKIVVHVPRGHFCGECGYNLRGVRSETCPECGRGFAVPHAVPLAEPVAGDGKEPRA